MIELPEATTLATQLNEAVLGRRVEHVVTGQSPHKWAWFHGDPEDYDGLLRGKAAGEATSHGGFVTIEIDDAQVLFAEGVILRWHEPDGRLPAKHQLLIEFENGFALTGSVQMYGGLWACRQDDFENPYIEAAKAAPSPLTASFDARYFGGIVGAPDVQKLSVKALLATEQRVPGLGNGVLQDILYEARLHPKRKVRSLSADEVDGLHTSVKTVLSEMSRLGGRDTEKDLFGQDGRYRTRCSRNSVGQPCPRCESAIVKDKYMGGTVYYCAQCQVP